MAIPSLVTLYKLNDQYVEIDGLAEALTGTVQNNATVSASLVDALGANVNGATNINLTFVASSNGKYRGLVANTFDPPVGVGYTLKLNVTTAGGLKMHMEIAAEVAIRTS
jgi:hypothetical protein